MSFDEPDWDDVDPDDEDEYTEDWDGEPPWGDEPHDWERYRPSCSSCDDEGCRRCTLSRAAILRLRVSPRRTTVLTQQAREVPVEITVVEIRPSGEFGGHVFEYESDTDLFKCVNTGCGIYEVVARANAREQGVGEITPCPAVSGTTDASARAVGGQTPFPADAHTGWSCDVGASLIAEAWHRPGPGRLGTLHGVIYVCPAHQADVERRIAGVDLSPEVRPAPPDHRRDPWPCGHITIYDTEGESLRRDTGGATTVSGGSCPHGKPLDDDNPCDRCLDDYAGIDDEYEG